MVNGLRCKFIGTSSEGVSTGSAGFGFGFGSLMILAVTEIESPFCIGASICVADPFLCSQGRVGEDSVGSGGGVGCGVGSCPGAILLVGIFGIFGKLGLLGAKDARFLKDHNEGDDFWPMGCGGDARGGLALASLRENDSRALIRVVMPDDTVPFFAANAYPESPATGGNSGSAVEVFGPLIVRGFSKKGEVFSDLTCIEAEAA